MARFYGKEPSAGFGNEVLRDLLITILLDVPNECRLGKYLEDKLPVKSLI